MTKQEELLIAARVVLDKATEPLLAVTIQARMLKDGLVDEAPHVTLNYALQKAAKDEASGIKSVGHTAHYYLEAKGFDLSELNKQRPRVSTRKKGKPKKQQTGVTLYQATNVLLDTLDKTMLGLSNYGPSKTAQILASLSKSGNQTGNHLDAWLEFLTAVKKHEGETDANS